MFSGSLRVSSDCLVRLQGEEVVGESGQLRAGELV
jgi:hypothetical protein